MYKVTEKVRELTKVDYDINVWADNEGQMDASWTVNVTFYPLVYSENELPTVDTSVFYTLRLPVVHRGKRISDALAYLDTLVTNSSDDYDAFDLQSMDWWSAEVVLEHPPTIIREFMDSLPREGK